LQREILFAANLHQNGIKLSLFLSLSLVIITDEGITDITDITRDALYLKRETTLFPRSSKRSGRMAD